jgi:hypothetical protein
MLIVYLELSGEALLLGLYLAYMREIEPLPLRYDTPVLFKYLCIHVCIHIYIYIYMYIYIYTYIYITTLRSSSNTHVCVCVFVCVCNRYIDR